MNSRFGPPADLAESQCSAVNAHVGTIKGGSMDGETCVVVCWQPTPEERERICSGIPIFLSIIGGLPPHYLSTSFEEATHPA